MPLTRAVAKGALHRLPQMRLVPLRTRTPRDTWRPYPSGCLAVAVEARCAVGRMSRLDRFRLAQLWLCQQGLRCSASRMGRLWADAPAVLVVFMLHTSRRPGIEGQCCRCTHCRRSWYGQGECDEKVRYWYIAIRRVAQALPNSIEYVATHISTQKKRRK